MPGGQVSYPITIDDPASSLNGRSVSVSYANGIPGFSRLRPQMADQAAPPAFFSNTRNRSCCSAAWRLCCANPLKAGVSFPWTELFCGLRERRPECGEAVQDGRPDRKLGDLAVEVASGQALAQQFRFADLRFTQCIFVSARLRR